MSQKACPVLIDRIVNPSVETSIPPLEDLSTSASQEHLLHVFAKSTGPYCIGFRTAAWYVTYSDCTCIEVPVDQGKSERPRQRNSLAPDMIEC